MPCRKITSFTHTLIEMFMVEANEAVARLFDSLDVPFLRRMHPDPDVQDSERLRHFTQVTGYKLPKDMDRKAIQALLEHVKGTPRSVRDQPRDPQEPHARRVFAGDARTFRARERALLALHQSDPSLRRPDDPPLARCLLRSNQRNI